MTLEEYLKQEFDYTEAEIKYILSKTNMRKLDLIIERVDFYRKLLKLTHTELKSLIKKEPTLLGRDVRGMEETSVINKWNFYKKSLKIEDDALIKLVKKFPVILTYDTSSDKPTSIKNKIKFYQATLYLSDNEIAEIIKIHPSLLNLDTISDEPTSVKSKIEFYKNTLGLDDYQVAKIIKGHIAWLGYDTVTDEPTSVKSKIKFYKDTFDLDDEQVVKMIKSHPVIIGYDTNSDKSTAVKAKIKSLETFMTKEQIAQNAAILSCSAQSVKLTYLLLTPYDENWYSRTVIPSASSIYARIQYLRSIGEPIKMHKINELRERFEKRHGAYLDESYPLTEDAIHLIERQFANVMGQTITLTKDEIEAVLSASNKKKKDNQWTKN